MKISDTAIKGVLLLDNFVSNDKRGLFVKTFHANSFQEYGLATNFRESYYSISTRDVLRGMHLQLPPHEHDKLVYVTKGRVLDLVVDLRPTSSTYRQHVAVELDEHKQAIYIPSGCAHGFLTLSEMATVVYNVTSVYNPVADTGIHWDSFGYKWPVKEPIISDRDSKFLPMNEFLKEFS